MNKQAIDYLLEVTPNMRNTYYILASLEAGYSRKEIQNNPARFNIEIYDRSLCNRMSYLTRKLFNKTGVQL